MITEKCVCGQEVTRTTTQKGTRVLADVVWEDGLKIQTKNFQPVEHKCYEKEKTKKSSKRLLGR